MPEGLFIIKPEAEPSAKEIVNDIKEYGLSIDQRIRQRWTREKIRGTYPPEIFEDWPIADWYDNIVFERHGKDPWIETMIITSEKESIESIKKNLVGRFDASFAQRPEEKHTLRYKYGLKKIRRPFQKDENIYYFYYNGSHLSSENRYFIEKELYYPKTIV